MNILSIGTLPPHQGGSSVSSWQVLRSLRRAGHRVRSIAASTAATRAESQAVDEALEGIESVRYELPAYATDMSASLAETLRIEQERVPPLMEQMIGADRPDVILSGRDTIAPALAATAARNGIPWVLRSTGYVLRVIEEGRQPQAVADAITGAARQADVITLQAAHLIPLAESLGYTPAVIVPNCVDERIFKPSAPSTRLKEELKIPEGAAVIVHASNLKPVKRAIDIVEAAPAVLAERPDAVFVVAGEGGCRADLIKRCEELKIGEHFRFPGWLPYSQVPELFSLADVVVMPSAFEQQAAVCLETQACGRTLVASDIAGAREVVEDGLSGLLFRTGDAGDLARKLIFALASPALRKSIGQYAATAVLKRHALAPVTAQFEAVLRQAVESRQERVACGATNANAR